MPAGTGAGGRCPWMVGHGQRRGVDAQWVAVEVDVAERGHVTGLPLNAAGHIGSDQGALV